MRHLRLVQTLAIEGTLTAAGQHLFLSQSALSHQLKEIEDEIGVKLFRRVKKKMILTPAGQRVLDGADMVLGEIDRVKEDISRLTSGETGTLRRLLGPRPNRPTAVGSGRSRDYELQVRVRGRGSPQAVRRRAGGGGPTRPPMGLEEVHHHPPVRRRGPRGLRS